MSTFLRHPLERGWRIEWEVTGELHLGLERERNVYPIWRLHYLLVIELHNPLRFSNPLTE